MGGLDKPYTLGLYWGCFMSTPEETAKRFYDKHGRTPRKKKKLRDDEVRYFEPPPRLRCPSCAATAKTELSLHRHFARFHVSAGKLAKAGASTD